MLKKTIRRLGALTMVLAMAVSVFAVNASAVDATENIQFKKSLVVTGEAHAKLPLAETFNFTVTEAGKSDETTYPNPGKEAITVSPVTFAKGATTSEQNITVTVKKEYFALKNSDNEVIGYKPGTYYYIIKETANSTDGMVYSGAEKKLAVQVLNDGTCKYYVVEYKNGEVTNAKDDAVFTNTYTAHKLTVAKQIEGDQADRNKAFDIYVTIKGAADETYETSAGTTLTSGTPAKISLKGGESIEIYNLSAGDTYTVTEDAKYKSEGYTITNEVTNDTAIGDSDKTVTIVNTKRASTPGGVIMTIAPYALMVVLAGAFAVVFLTRRNRAE